MCMYVCMYVGIYKKNTCLSVDLLIAIVHLDVPLSQSIDLPVIYRSMYLSLSIYPCISLPTYLPTYLPIYLPTFLAIYLSSRNRETNLYIEGEGEGDREREREGSETES